MYASVKTVLEKYSNEWTVLPAFQSTFNNYVQEFDLLQSTAQKQINALVGVRAVKDHERVAAVKKFYVLSSALSAFAVVSEDVELFNRTRYTRNALSKLSREELLIQMSALIDLGTQHVNDLAPYSVDQAFMDDIILLHNEMKVVLNSPRQAIIERKRATERLELICSRLDQILNDQLDKLVDILEAEHPDLFTDYRNARKVVDYGIRHNNPERDDGGDEEPHDDPTEE